MIRRGSIQAKEAKQKHTQLPIGDQRACFGYISASIYNNYMNYSALFFRDDRSACEGDCAWCSGWSLWKCYTDWHRASSYRLHHRRRACSVFDEANKGAKVVNTSVSGSSIWSSNNITRPTIFSLHTTPSTALVHSLVMDTANISNGGWVWMLPNSVSSPTSPKTQGTRISVFFPIK